MNFDQRWDYLQGEIEDLKEYCRRSAIIDSKIADVQRQLREMKEEAEQRENLQLRKHPVLGALCIFWDKYVSHEGKSLPFQALVRPFHHASYLDQDSVRAGHLTSTGSGYRYFAADPATGTAIGHGWKYVLEVDPAWVHDPFAYLLSKENK